MRTHTRIDIAPYRVMIRKFMESQFRDSPEWGVHDADTECKECDKAFGADGSNTFNGVNVRSILAQLGIVVGISARPSERFDKEARDMLRTAAGVFARAFQIDYYKELWPK